MFYTSNNILSIVLSVFANYKKTVFQIFCKFFFYNIFFQNLKGKKMPTPPMTHRKT